MKLQGAWLCVSGLVSVAMVGLINLRRKEVEVQEKAEQFGFVKLRVTMDLLSEYQHKVVHAHSLTDKTAALLKQLEAELSALRAQELGRKSEAEDCAGDLKYMIDDEASMALETANLKADFAQQKVRWEEEMASLKQQAAQRSKVCDFVKDSVETREMCGDDVFKKKKAPKKKAPKKKPEEKEALKEDALKEDALKKEDLKKDALNEDALKEDGLNEGGLKKDALKEDGLKKDALKEDGLKKDALNEDALKENALNEDALNEEALKEEDLKEDALKKEDLKEEDLKEEDLKEEDSQEWGRENENQYQ